MHKYIVKKSKYHKKFLFIDRDGTLIPEPRNYWIRNESEIQELNFNVDLMKKLLSLDFGIIIITNQRGIALQEVELKAYIGICHKLENLLKHHGIEITAIFTCPHDSECYYCRKPNAGMILEAAKMFDINLEECWTIGDNKKDINAGQKAKTKVAMIQKRYIQESQEFPVFDAMDRVLEYIYECEVNK